MGINNFADVDLSATPRADLVDLRTKTKAALDQRLNTPADPDNIEVAESYTINGRTVQRTATQFLMELLGAIDRALRLQSTSNANGLNFLDTGFDTPGAGHGPGRSNCGWGW